MPRPHIMKCPNCGRYTLKKICPNCGRPTSTPHPPKFIPVFRLSQHQPMSNK